MMAMIGRSIQNSMVLNQCVCVGVTCVCVAGATINSTATYTHHQLTCDLQGQSQRLRQALAAIGST